MLKFFNLAVNSSFDTSLEELTLGELKLLLTSLERGLIFVANKVVNIFVYIILIKVELVIKNTIAKCSIELNKDSTIESTKLPTNVYSNTPLKVVDCVKNTITRDSNPIIVKGVPTFKVLFCRKFKLFCA